MLHVDTDTYAVSVSNEQTSGPELQSLLVEIRQFIFNIQFDVCSTISF